MACAQCDGRPFQVIGSYPAAHRGSSMAASHFAASDAVASGVDTHFHYVARGDKYVVVRPTVPQEVPA